MNERIAELMRSKGLHKHISEDCQHRMEMLAELIVRECADIELYWLSEQDRKAVAEKIKQHFGVEE